MLYQMTYHNIMGFQSLQKIITKQIEQMLVNRLCRVETMCCEFEY